jgi:hypothetical protein
MHSKGTEYIYVNFPPERWPSTSKIIPTNYASQELRTQIDNCFGPNSGYQGFGNSISLGGFLVIADLNRHNIEYEKAMRIKNQKSS